MKNRDALIALRDAVKAGTWRLSTEIGYVFSDPQYVLIAQAYEGSLDAAEALHEAVLPGWAWTIESAQSADVWPLGRPTASLRAFSDEGNPARAWLLAILEALIAEAGE
jgi:hypothetical protein